MPRVCWSNWKIKIYIFNASYSYNHYVELVEPADRRACIKCCDNFDDCPLDRGKDLCSLVSYIFGLNPFFRYCWVPQCHPRQLLQLRVDEISNGLNTPQLPLSIWTLTDFYFCFAFDAALNTIHIGHCTIQRNDQEIQFHLRCYKGELDAGAMRTNYLLVTPNERQGGKTTEIKTAVPIEQQSLQKVTRTEGCQDSNINEQQAFTVRRIKQIESDQESSSAQ